MKQSIYLENPHNIVYSFLKWNKKSVLKMHYSHRILMNLNTQRLSTKSHPYFETAWKLYEQSFPAEERRTYTKQINLLSCENYHFELIKLESSFIGFILWWKFDDLSFIEHFAIMPFQQGKGFGSAIIESIILQSPNLLLLEVELPTDTARKRRIKFYETKGFKLNMQHYKQPPLQEGSQSVQLNLMSYPTKISDFTVREFVSKYHPIIYK